MFPVVPTTFTESGELDLESQKRCVDFMIDAGSNGLCILANFSEQFVLSDDERELLTRTILEHVAGRVPVIVTTTHFSTRICAERSRRAQDAGAAMVMVMPPYHGATIPRRPRRRSSSSTPAVRRHRHPDHDPGRAGQPARRCRRAFLARMASEIEQVAYFKIETAGAAAKLRELIRLGGDAIEGPWDGEEAITLLPDLDAGATGSMTGGGYPGRHPPDPRRLPRRPARGRRRRLRALAAADQLENRQCGLLAAKALMKEGGIIACEAPRHPFPALHPDSRAAARNRAPARSAGAALGGLRMPRVAPASAQRLKPTRRRWTRGSTAHRHPSGRPREGRSWPRRRDPASR